MCLGFDISDEMMDDLYCTGNEERLADCSFGGWGESDCNRGSEATVECGICKYDMSYGCNVLCIVFDTYLERNEVEYYVYSKACC